MGEIAEMMLDGTLCQCCGVYLGNEEPSGFPETCEDCASEDSLTLKRKIMTNNKKLKNFLKEHNACEDGYIFAKDLTLKQFLDTCPRGDWILWLFTKINPESLKELTLVKGHCANTVRHLMKDDRSVKAVDAAIKFGEGKISKKELDNAYAAAYAAAYAYTDADAHAYAYPPAAAARCAAAAAAYASYASYAAAYAAADTAAHVAHAADYATASAARCAAAADYAKVQYQEKTANICRKYLPIKIWNNI